MAPHDSRNIFCNTEEEEPVVFPHHLLMIAVASTATKGSNVKSCPQESMENVKSLNYPKTNEDLNKTTTESHTKEMKKDMEDEQSEIRLIIDMTCTVEVDENSSKTRLSLLLRLEDQMNRELRCSVSENERGIDLANELVEYGLISEVDRDKVAKKIDEHLDMP